MTAPAAAATALLPTGAIHNPAAIARALCDGSGLITFPTPDGPEHAACLGCPACTSRAAVVARPAFAGMPTHDDEAPF